MPQTERIAEFLLSVGAVRLSLDKPFTWVSGIRSPIYCDNRLLYSHPRARSFIVDALVGRVRSLHIPPDIIAGTATAAIGWSALVADRLDLPFVYVRSKPKEHGLGKRIEGDLAPERHVAVMEDLLSTGGSAASTVHALREEGRAIVTDVVSIFTYEFLATAELALESKITLHPLTNLTTLLKVAVDQDRISSEEASLIAQFAKDPVHWAVP